MQHNLGVPAICQEQHNSQQLVNGQNLDLKDDKECQLSKPHTYKHHFHSHNFKHVLIVIFKLLYLDHMFLLHIIDSRVYASNETFLFFFFFCQEKQNTQNKRFMRGFKAKEEKEFLKEKQQARL